MTTTPLLSIDRLSASVDGTPILKGFSLHIFPGEIHAVMGPNGAGKSTLGKVLAGHPSYEITGGEVYFKGVPLLELEPEERSHMGLFLGFQYPVEIPGVSNHEFLRSALNEKRSFNGQAPLSEQEFSILFDHAMKKMEMREEFKGRNVNEHFSGGEKKRNEILQMAILKPDLAILDETDSGLDIDAMRIVAQGVNSQMHGGMGLLLITHYQRLLDYIRPHKVHVMIDGKIVRSGTAQLALELEQRGYDWLTQSEKVMP